MWADKKAVAAKIPAGKGMTLVILPLVKAGTEVRNARLIVVTNTMV